ncbi:MAG: hypothetical protein MZV70_03520 [Desulfobacterales bacterium]|nr:hypothetical protein [Desulfobacterales bacterium]
MEMFDPERLKEKAATLKAPSPMFRLLTPAENDISQQAAELARRLLTSRLYLSDELRNEEYVHWLIGSWFNLVGQ